MADRKDGALTCSSRDNDNAPAAGTRLGGLRGADGPERSKCGDGLDRADERHRADIQPIDEDGVGSTLADRSCQRQRLSRACDAPPDRWRDKQRHAGESRGADENGPTTANASRQPSEGTATSASAERGIIAGGGAGAA